MTDSEIESFMKENVSGYSSIMFEEGLAELFVCSFGHSSVSESVLTIAVKSSKIIMKGGY